MSTLPAAPASLTPANRPLPFGRYAGAIGDPGIATWDAERGSRRRFQRKSWIYGGIFTDEWLLGVAIADAGYIGLAFCYYYDRASGTFIEEKAMRPFAFARDYVPSLTQPWAFRAGKKNWSVVYADKRWRYTFQGKRLQLDFSLEHAADGLTALAPARNRPFNSTFKLAAVPADGQLRVDGREVAVSRPSGAVDFTLGYPARRTFWNWACLSGRTEDGRSIGINLVAHFNEGLENALWLDGNLIPLRQAQFQPGADRRRDRWLIDTADEIVSLEFEPEGARAENLQLGLIRSRFIQPFGKFRGTLRLDGRTSAMQGYGVVEEHFARW